LRKTFLPGLLLFSIEECRDSLVVWLRCGGGGESGPCGAGKEMLVIVMDFEKQKDDARNLRAIAVTNPQKNVKTHIMIKVFISIF